MNRPRYLNTYLSEAASTIFLLLVFTPASVTAQQTWVSVAAGSFEYDAALDDSYPMIGLSVGREFGSLWRVGAGFSRARIGNIPRSHLLERSDETVWRVYLTAGPVAHRPFRGSSIPIINRTSFSGSIRGGVFHQSGIAFDTAFINLPFVDVSQTTTAMSLGLNAMAQVELGRGLSLDAGLSYWADRVFVSRLDDFEQFIGLSFAW